MLDAQYESSQDQSVVGIQQVPEGLSAPGTRPGDERSIHVKTAGTVLQETSEVNLACGSFIKVILHIYQDVVSRTEGKDISDLPLEPGKPLSQVLQNFSETQTEPVN